PKGTVTGRGSFDQGRLDGTATVTAKEGQLQVTGDVLFPRGIPYSPAVWLGNSAATPRWNVRAVLDKADPSSFLGFLKQPASGSLSGTASFSGTPAKPTLAFDVQGQNVLIGKENLGTATVQGRYSGSVLHVSQMSFQGPSGSASLSGDI